MRAHTGARVSPLSVDEIEEIFATRVGIEGWLARHGAARLGDADLAKMTEEMKGLRRAERGGGSRGVPAHSWAMRATCYSAAEKPRLFDRFQTLYELASRYVYLMMAEPARLKRSRREMEAFFAACRERDGPATAGGDPGRAPDDALVPERGVRPRRGPLGRPRLSRSRPTLTAPGESVLLAM